MCFDKEQATYVTNFSDSFVTEPFHVEWQDLRYEENGVAIRRV